MDYNFKISKSSLNISDTLDCGQCFRFKKENNIVTGVAFNKVISLSQNDEAITFYDTTEEDFLNIWSDFLDINRDYESIKKSFLFDDTLKKAIDFAGGIRILKQDSFETLCSFIISQNNNIPRIKSTIEKFCQRFGSPISDGFYTFPSYDSLIDIKKEDLQGLSLGYRDDYILDLIACIKDGRVNIKQISDMPLEQARKSLLQIKGVGIKVAECALLFGFQQFDAFPVDTWIKKVLLCYYKDGFPIKENSGIAQQYLFHYIRNLQQ